MEAALGTRGLVLLAQSAYVVRVLVYTLLRDPWYVLFVEPCHGVTFASSCLAVIAFTGRVAPPGFEATTQGIFNGIFNGLGPMLGVSLGGYMYDTYGAVFMFRAAALVVFVSAVLFFIVTPDRLKVWCGAQPDAAA